MSISQNSKLTWSDVKAIYTNLNKPREDRSTEGTQQYYGGRPNFGFDAVTVPERKDKAFNLSDLSLLNAFIKEMSSNSYLTSVATGITLPAAGSKALPSFLSQLNTQVTNINNTCLFNPFTSCFDFNPFTSCFGFNPFTSCFDFNPFTSCFGFDPDFCFSSDFCFSTNFSTQGSCFGACHGSCFAFGSDMSCATHSCSSSYGTCSGDGCQGFGCSEQCSGGCFTG